MIIPTHTRKIGSEVEKILLKNKLVLGTSLGLVKKTNEDQIGYTIPKNKPNTVRICVADGHWGSTASKKIIKFWLNENLNFPINRESAITTTQHIEKKLFKSFGKENMNEQTDLTPEGAFTVCEINKLNQLTVVSYGDCRLLIANKQRIKYQLLTQSTWLGAFSSLGLRNRIPVEKALVFETYQLQLEDYLLLFTDGVDECVYNKPTIKPEQLAQLTKKVEPETIFDSIFKQVFLYGAEDNVSLGIFKL